MKTIGIMQPYFFPYIGYFQLIDAVDLYINLDHVSFMKGSYMTRNVLKNNTHFNIPCIGASQNKQCNEILVKVDGNYWKKFFKTIECLYKKETNYEVILNDILYPWSNYIQRTNPSISHCNMSSINYICNYLNIKTTLHWTSEQITTRKKNEGLQDIVKYFDGTNYINAIGGQKLYNKEDFASQNIDIKFIQMGDVEFNNPYSSILDLLFTYPKEHIQEQLKKYTLI